MLWYIILRKDFVLIPDCYSDIGGVVDGISYVCNNLPKYVHSRYDTLLY